jgi:UDP-N-acetylglucosamine--N-acetylmuramyl-(pentapeptide) pyrophosphoryl-undecaprenol N-acetylglucosamine transferase
MDLRVVIAAGGTGGHLFPGIAVAREFQAAAGAAVTFITTPKAVSSRILESYGCTYEALESRALKGAGLFGRGRALLGVPGGILRARRRLADLAPHLVLGMGGHTSGVVGVAAWTLGIPLALHEQNAIPGAANGYLSRLAGRVFVSFPETKSYLGPGRAVWTGNPIREEFFQPHPDRPPAPFTVLITGGSQGARHLNFTVLAALPRLQDLKENLRLLHLTGELDFEQVAAGYRESGFDARVAAFSPEMPDLMGQAHLIVCRAGASTLAELAALGRAALLVPYPFAANNHQEHNARFFREVGAAELILNKDFTPDLFADKIKQFISAPGTLAPMEEASRRLARPDAARDIVKGCLELIEQGLDSHSLEKKM